MLNFLGGVLTREEEHISWALILPGSELVKGCSNNAPFLANFPRMLPPGKIRHFCTGIYSNSWFQHPNGQHNVQSIRLWLAYMYVCRVRNKFRTYFDPKKGQTMFELFQCIKSVLWWFSSFPWLGWTWHSTFKNKLASLEATLVRNYSPPNQLQG